MHLSYLKKNKQFFQLLNSEGRLGHDRSHLNITQYRINDHMWRFNIVKEDFLITHLPHSSWLCPLVTVWPLTFVWTSSARWRRHAGYRTSTIRWKQYMQLIRIISALVLV